MMNRLAVVIAEFSDNDSDLLEVLAEWTEAHIVERLALIDASKVQTDVSVRCRFASHGQLSEMDLFDLVTSQIWDRVTVLAVRSAPLASYSDSHFSKELDVLRMMEAAFIDNAVTVVRSCTVSIIETTSGSSKGFAPEWGIHIAQEPVVRIDPAVASQPMRSDHRSLLIALLSMTVAGGFVWQPGPLLDDARDVVRGDHKPIRVGRSFLRVVNAGRLTDEILAGAFPPSGPWSVPGDIANARAVPPGTHVPESVIDQLQRVGKFGYEPLTEKARFKGTRIGLLDGVKLFFREFWSALAGIPLTMVATVRGEIESWVQKVTFGEDSSLLLRFDPLATDVDLDEVSSIIQVQSLGQGIEAIGSSLPWENLQKVSFGLVDGGKYPEGFEAPKSGVHRLVFTDPQAIGPSPTYPRLDLLESEKTILEIPDTVTYVTPMDVAVASAIKDRIRLKLEDPKAKLPAMGPEPAKVQSEASPAVEANEDRESGLTESKSQKPKKEKRKKRVFPLRRKNDSKILLVNSIASEDQINGEIEREKLPTGDTLGETSAHQEPRPSSESGTKIGTIDRHIPGHHQFVPNEYEFVSRFYQGKRAEIAAKNELVNSEYEAALDISRVPVGNWTLNKTCDHCGTKFDHGVLIRHRPTGALIHVGRVCAEKAYSMSAITEYERSVLEALLVRIDEWIEGQSKSLLWRVGERVHRGRDAAGSALQRAVEMIAQRPAAQEAQSKARKRFQKWTRRGVWVFLLILAACIGSVFLGPLPLLILGLTLATYSVGLVAWLIRLARDLVRVRYRLAQIENQYERAFAEGRHSISELVRLASVNEQFMDWQAIIREIVHVPFGRDTLFASMSRTIEDVRRPPGFVLAAAHPDDAQKMRPYMNARSQTMHSGWLSGIRDVLFEEWKERYVNSRMLSPADNILPESDNSSAQSVVGRHPFSNEDVYYPRADLRRRLVGGRLQKRLVSEKSQQIAEDLRRTPIESLLGTVEVVGPGSALSGLPVLDFLSSLSRQPEEPVAFLPDLISDSYPELREMTPELILPSNELLEARIGNVQVEPGVEFTAAAWVIELSGPVGPLAALRGMGISNSATIPVIDNETDEPSVS